MLTRKEKWWNSMIAKYGSREAVIEFQRTQQRKSREVGDFSNSGFAHMKRTNPERLAEISRKGNLKRHGKQEDAS